jgi:threonine synthase
VFCEPASASGVAGLLKLAAAGRLQPGLTITCTLTGNGLKDPQWALADAPDPVVIPVDAKRAAKELGMEG